MDEYLSLVAVLLMVISAALPFLEIRLRKRSEKIKTECLLIANDNDWISVEEISGHVKTSLRTVVKNIEWGIKERIIIGVLENNMFERRYYRTPEEVAFYIPFEQEEI